MIYKKLSLFVIALVLSATTSVTIFAQNELGIITNIQLVPRKNDTDVLVLKGNAFNRIDPIKIQRLDYQASSQEKDYQWQILLPNADLSEGFKQRLNASASTVTNRGGNVVERLQIRVTATKNIGTLKSTVLIKAKIQDSYYVENPFAAVPVEDVAETTLKEIVFQRGFIDQDEQFLIQQATAIQGAKLAGNIPSEKQVDLAVPILRLNIVGVDGAKNILDSQATQLSIYLNEHRRDEINQKFGIQFFVNSISLDRSKVIDKTIIYYRYDDTIAARRFLKEALYIAKIIPSESVIKPMLDQEKKVNVDIEIYVGKNLK